MKSARRRDGADTARTGNAPFGAMTLPGARVTLRSLTSADVPAIYGFFADRAVTRYWSRSPMTEIAQAEALLRDITAGYRTGERLQLGIERHGDRALVGTCTLFHFYRGSRRAEVGYALGSPYWGQGLMHDALQTLLAFAFDDLNLNRVEADIDPLNAASARTLERLGFVSEGRLRERWIVDGVISDTEIYGLLRNEWRRPAG